MGIHTASVSQGKVLSNHILFRGIAMSSSPGYVLQGKPFVGQSSVLYGACPDLVKLTHIDT